MKNATSTTFSKTTFVSLCSLSIGLWGYQTGIWQLAIPMVLALEARFLIKRRWKISLEHYQLLSIGAAFLWLLSIFYIPSASPAPIPYATSHHILKCLPIGLFPLVLAQTYCVNCASLNQQIFGPFFGANKPINLYYPYFGICLLAASATGGNTMLFLGITAGLVAGFLGTLRSQRFSPALFYGLIGLALILCLMGTHEVQRLQANLKFKGPDIGALMQNIASSLSQDQKQTSESAEKQSPSLKIDPNLQAEALQKLESLLKGGKPSDSKANEMAQNTNPSPASSTASPSPSSSPTAIPSTGSTENISPSQTSSSTSSSPSPVSAPSSSASSPPPSAESGSSQSVDKPVESSGSEPILSSPSAPISSSQTSSPPSGMPGTTTTMASTQGVPAATQGSQNSNPTSQSGGNQNGTGSSSAQGGSGNAKSGSSLIQSAGGSADPQQSSTQIGKSGSLVLSDAILFRVAPTSGQNSHELEPNFPLYLREAAYNQYSQGTWNAGTPRFVTKNSTSKRRWIFGSRTPNTASVRIVGNLTQGPLRLPVGTSEIDNLAVDSIQANQYGTVLAQGNPGEVAYTVQFDPTQSLDSPPTQQDLEIPQAEQATMQTILKSLNLSRTSDQAILQAISAFFDDGFQYTLNLPQSQQNTTPLSAFLLDHRSGHCEYFASATSLLLRAAGIPTRYTVGYSVHEYSPAEQQYIVRAKHAHAWVMAYANGSWISLDTTPGGGSAQGGTAGTLSGGGLSQESNAGSLQSGGLSQDGKAGKVQESGLFRGSKIPGSKTQNSKAQSGKSEKTPKDKLSPLKSHSQKYKTKLEPSPAVNEKDKKTLEKKVDPVQAVKSFFKKVSTEGSKLLSVLSKRTDTLAWVGVILVLGFTLIFLAVFFVWRAIAHKFFARRKPGARGNVAKPSEQTLMDGLDSEFYLIEKRLGEWGLERKPSETIRQWILRLKQKLPETKMNSLNEIIDLHYRYRFDPDGIVQDDRTRLRSMIQSWLRETRTQGV